MTTNEAPEIDSRAASSGPQALLRRVVTYKIDLILLLAAAASLITSCVIISPKKPFWNDELIAWMPINDPSIGHMFSALRNGVDAAPPLFHFSARAWALFFGGDEMGLRLFASAGFCLALIVLWFTLRRHYGSVATGFGLLTIWCTSSLFLYQNSEARNYGLFCAACAVTVAVYQALADRTEKMSARLAAVTIVCQAGLVMSHLYGIVYGGLTLLALVAWDWLNGRFRPVVYATFAAGWLVLVPWLPTLWRVSQSNLQHGWIQVPDLSALAAAYSFYIQPHVLFVFLALAAAGVLIASRSRAADQVPETDSSRAANPLLAVAVTYMMAPLLAFAGSHVISPFFVARYMLPSSIGAAILLATAAQGLLCKANFLPGVSAHWAAVATLVVHLTWAAFFAGLLAYPVVLARSLPKGEPPNPAVEQYLIPNLPVVTEHVYDFMLLSHYTRRPDRPYYFILDLEVASDPRMPRDQLFLHKERKIWRDNGYLADRTLTTAEFLCNSDQFMVLHYPGLIWNEERVLKDPAFQSQPVATLGDHMLWLVRRKPGQTPAVCRP